MKINAGIIALLVSCLACTKAPGPTPPQGIGIRLCALARQNISNAGGGVAIKFDTVKFQNGVTWPYQGDTAKVLIESHGYYLVGGHVSLQYHPDGMRAMDVNINGKTHGSVQVSPSQFGATILENHTLLELWAGDVVTVSCNQNSGTTLISYYQDDEGPLFYLWKLGD